MLLWVLQRGEAPPPATTLLPGEDPDTGECVAWKHATYSGRQLGRPHHRLVRGVAPCGVVMARSITNGVPGVLHCGAPLGHPDEDGHVSADGLFRAWEPTT